MKMANYLKSLTKPEIEDYKRNCNFTDEEELIFDYLTKGKSWTWITMELNICEKTVDNRVKSIKKKMEVIDNDGVKVPIWEKINLTIEEASEYSNIGTSRLHEMARDPKCPFVLYVGTKKLIKRKAFEDFLKNQIEL